MSVNPSIANNNNLPISHRGLPRHNPKVWLKDQPPRPADRVFPMVVVGKFIDSRSFSEKRVQGWIDSRWRKNGSIVVEKVGSVFMMHCSDIRDRDNLVDQETASLNEALYVMAPWYPQALVQPFRFEYACLWVRVEGLPMNASSLEFVKVILNGIGIILYFDEETMRPGTKEFLRVKLRVPLKLSLILGFYFEASLGEFVWVFLRYEHVFVFCKKCGRIGHVSDECRVTAGDMQNLIGKRMGEIANSQQNVQIGEFHEDMCTEKLIGLKRSNIYKDSAINLVNYNRWRPERVIRRKKPYPLSSDSSSSLERSDSSTRTHRKRKVRGTRYEDDEGVIVWGEHEERGPVTKKIRLNVPIYIRRGVTNVAPITVDKRERVDSSDETLDIIVGEKDGGNSSDDVEKFATI